MRHPLAALAICGVVSLSGTASAGDPPFFAPPPASTWPADVDSSLFFPVVLVGAEVEGRRQTGCGVVIAGTRAEGRAWVLTCEHVVTRKSAPASTVRVGLLRHTYTDPARAAADYEEVVAAVVSSSVEHDLALLELRVSGPLHDAPVGERLADLHFRTPPLVTLMPSLRPTVATYSLHHYFQPGQSGSPLIEHGLVVGLAQARHGSTVSPRAIADLVSRVPGGEPVVQRWEKIAAMLNEYLKQRGRK